MKTAVAAALFALSFQVTPAMAADATPAPKCASSDPVVGVNTTAKTYMTQAQMTALTKGMTPAQTDAMMTKNHVSMMCLSNAKAMGATMVTTTPGGTGNATDPGAVKPGGNGGSTTESTGNTKTSGGTGNATDPGAVKPGGSGSAAAPGGGPSTTPGGTGNATDPGAVKPGGPTAPPAGGTK